MSIAKMKKYKLKSKKDCPVKDSQYWLLSENINSIKGVMLLLGFFLVGIFLR